MYWGLSIGVIVSMFGSELEWGFWRITAVTVGLCVIAGLLGGAA